MTDGIACDEPMTKRGYIELAVLIYLANLGILSTPYGWGKAAIVATGPVAGFMLSVFRAHGRRLARSGAPRPSP